jgi:inorganic pyrophosphatase
MDRDNTTLDGTPGKLDPDKVRLPPVEDLSPAPVEQDLDEWFYIDRGSVKDKEGSLDGSDLRIVMDLRG